MQETSSSNRFSSPAGDERQEGFVLVVVLVIAVLYLGLIQLVLIESGAKLRGAERFRSRITADILAEEAIELAAEGMTTSPGRRIDQRLVLGRVEGTFERRPGGRFRISGKGRTVGVSPREASVIMEGRIRGNRIFVDRSSHRRSWD